MSRSTRIGISNPFKLRDYVRIFFNLTSSVKLEKYLRFIESINDNIQFRNSSSSLPKPRPLKSWLESSSTPQPHLRHIQQNQKQFQTSCSFFVNFQKIFMVKKIRGTKNSVKTNGQLRIRRTFATFFSGGFKLGIHIIRRWQSETSG